MSQQTTTDPLTPITLLLNPDDSHQLLRQLVTEAERARGLDQQVPPLPYFQKNPPHWLVSAQLLSPELKSELNMFAGWIISSLVDGIFVVVWVHAQEMANNVINATHLSGLDNWVLAAIQLLLAIATLIPILTHICVSTVRRGAQVWRVIGEELRAENEKGQ